MITDRLHERFDTQRQAYREHPFPSLNERRHRLNLLKQLILSHREEIADALNEDFGGRSAQETLNAEVLPSIMGINHALKHLNGWMKPRRRPVHWLFQPASSQVVPQPLGVVGIIVPWNYALYLAIGPLTAALAAGNNTIVKISEYTPRFGALFEQWVNEIFDAGVLTVVNGDVEVAQTFSALPFDHLLFTGSTAVGKHVMAAAAKNLTPVTLELGGKSPAVIDRSIPVQEAAQRLVFAKCLNAGQTCIAPDYVLCPAEQVDEFVRCFLDEVKRQYGNPLHSPDYSAIINDRQWQRLRGYLAQAETDGAQLHWSEPPQTDGATGRKIPPVLLTGVSTDSEVMQEEIFGPILPILPYDNLEETITFINQRERPLALYVFGYDHRLRRIFIERTHSGGLVFNDALIHVAQDNLPFGGIGASGMGHYHGREGFETFSKLKPVLAKQRLSSLKLAYPPYGRWIHRLMARIFLR